jgi:GT2 family glycosyltransferase
VPSGVSAIIVAYKTPAELAAAVASLHAQDLEPEEIIVVDNGAPDGDPVPEPSELQDFRVVRPPTNLGYGGGCKAAARAASGDKLLIMNADVILTASATHRLSDRLETDARIAVVGPRILSGGRVQPSARGWPSLRTGLFGRRSIGTRLLVRTGHYPPELRPAHGPGGQVDWVSGACMMIRASAFWEVDGFDDGFWMYWEDADLCRRLMYREWKVAYEPRAVVHHATGASGTSERTIRAFHESAALFSRRHLARNRLQQYLIELVLTLRANLILRTWRLKNSRS